MTLPDVVPARRRARRGTAVRGAVLLPVLVAALAGCTTTVEEEPAGSTASVEQAAEPAPEPAAPTPSPSPSAPGGLYVGYYQEDREDNPEDPMPGSFYLWLPEEDTEFSGAMSFTYIGCQDTNIGTVSGVKDLVRISGDWTGSVDENPVGGPYSGLYDLDEERFAGTYENADGKLHVVVQGCIEYYVATEGVWEMSAPGAKDPDTFDVAVEDGDLTWTEVDGAAGYLVGVYDVVAAREGRQAILGQTLVVAGQGLGNTMSLDSLGSTVAGGEYVVAVSAFSAGGDRLGYTSRAWTP